MKFKLGFPTGHYISNIDNGNLDMQLYLENVDVIFFTLFTVQNIAEMICRKNEQYFTCPGALIVRDLSLETITVAIQNMIDNECENLIAPTNNNSRISKVLSHLRSDISFEDLPNVSSGLDSSWLSK